MHFAIFQLIVEVPIPTIQCFVINFACLFILKVDQDDFAISLEDTTCSIDAFERGSGQKVVSFSFYGDINSEYVTAKGFFEGIISNLKLMPQFYPDWIMRVYFDLDPRDPVLDDLCQLACKNPLLDLCHAGQLPGTPMFNATKVFPMIWRFFPTLDPQVRIVSVCIVESFFHANKCTVYAYLAIFWIFCTFQCYLNFALYFRKNRFICIFLCIFWHFWQTLIVKCQK